MTPDEQKQLWWIVRRGLMAIVAFFDIKYGKTEPQKSK